MRHIKIGKLLLVLLMLALMNTASAMPKVIFTFDDGDTGVYLKAFPIMKANNQPGVAFLITGQVPGASGTRGWADLSLNQANDLYANNWDISSHTVNHYDLTTRSAAALNTELANSKNWLNSSGFIRSYRFLAYPYGAYNTNVIAAVKANGYLAARTVNDNAGGYKAYKLTDPDIFEMKTLMVYPFPVYGEAGAPPNVVKNKINDTITQDGLLILSFHIITDSCCIFGANAPEEYKTSDFKIISDFLKSKEDAGQLKVVTMSEYFGTSPSPSPTPTSTITPTVIPTPTITPTVIPTPTITPTVTPPTPIPTPIPTPTGTPVKVKINTNADTYTSTKTSTANYGTSTWLSGEAGVAKVYMKFDGVSVIPSTATVVNATLYTSTSYSEGTGTLVVYPVTGNWAEGTLTLNNAPASGTAVSSITYTKCSDCWNANTGYGNIVQGWVRGDAVNYGIVASSTTGSYMEFNSKETNYIAYLSVTYINGGVPIPTPTVITTPTPTPTPTPGISITYRTLINSSSGFYQVDDITTKTAPIYINYTLNIKKGDKVRWLNKGTNSVLVVSQEKLFANKTLGMNSRYTYTFNVPGSYNFYLGQYPSKTQRVNVI